MQCPRCGNNAQPQQKFCATCGSPLPPITTPLASPGPNREPSGALATGGDFAPYQSPAEAALTRSPRSSSLPFWLIAGIALLAIVGTLFAVAFAATRPRDGASGPLAAATATIVPVDTTGLLDKSAAAMKVITTLHYRSEAGFYPPVESGAAPGSSTPLSMTINGDLALPDRYTMNTDADALGQFIVIGDNTWSRVTNGKWVHSSTGQAPLGPVNPLAIANYVKYYKPETVEQISSESRGGVILRRVRFDVDTARMAQDAGAQSVQGMIEQSRITADVWIRDGDNLIDSISLAVELSSGSGVILRSFFSNYNQEVVISPPDTQ